eukprot:2327722-Prymnesium_polylepis.1
MATALDGFPVRLGRNQTGYSCTVRWGPPVPLTADGEAEGVPFISTLYEYVHAVRRQRRETPSVQTELTRTG